MPYRQHVPHAMMRKLMIASSLARKGTEGVIKLPCSARNAAEEGSNHVHEVVKMI